jgi:hypothetical protein
MPAGFQNYSMMEQSYHVDLFKKVNSPGYTPSQADLNYLEKIGMIKKSKPQPAYAGGGGGFGGFRGGRGGGGGRGRGSGGGFGGVQQGDRLPAFSSGGGFGGLVNWRL